MSQMNVERVVGLLATDEGLRRRFAANAQATLKELAERGMELTECEQWALGRLDPSDLERFAGAMDGRLQRIEEWRDRP